MKGTAEENQEKAKEGARREEENQEKAKEEARQEERKDVAIGGVS